MARVRVDGVSGCFLSECVCVIGDGYVLVRNECSGSSDFDGIGGSRGSSDSSNTTTIYAHERTTEFWMRLPRSRSRLHTHIPMLYDYVDYVDDYDDAKRELLCVCVYVCTWCVTWAQESVRDGVAMTCVGFGRTGIWFRMGGGDASG